MIGIVAAHPVELRLVIRRLTDRRRGRGVIYGCLGDVPVAVRCLGQGWRRAEAGTVRLFEMTHCTALVMTGFAGATQGGMVCGDLVIPDVVVDLHRDPEAPDGPRYRSPLDLQAVRSAAGGRGGLLVTAGGLIESPGRKARLGQRTGAAAVDLESAAVVAVAQARGVPWVVARVILDSVDRPLGVRSVRHAGWLAVSILGWGRLGSFLKDVAVAQQRAGEHVQAVVAALWLAQEGALPRASALPAQRGERMRS